MCGFDAEELAVLCGVTPRSIGVQLNAFDGLELPDVDVLEVDVDTGDDADTLQREIQ